RDADPEQHRVVGAAVRAEDVLRQREVERHARRGVPADAGEQVAGVAGEGLGVADVERGGVAAELEVQRDWPGDPEPEPQLRRPVGPGVEARWVEATGGHCGVEREVDPEPAQLPGEEESGTDVERPAASQWTPGGELDRLAEGDGRPTTLGGDEEMLAAEADVSQRERRSRLLEHTPGRRRDPDLGLVERRLTSRGVGAEDAFHRVDD